MKLLRNSFIPAISVILFSHLLIAETLAPIPFVSFALTGKKILYHPQTGLTLKADEIVVIKGCQGVDEKKLSECLKNPLVQFTGTALQYLSLINQLEAELNQKGFTLATRKKFDDPIVLKMFPEVEINPNKLLEKQIAKFNDLPAEIARELIRPSIKNCPQLRLANLGNDPLTGLPINLKDTILVGDLKIPVADFIRKMNEAQNFLCTIGYSMLPKDLGDSKINIQKVLQLRNELMAKLHISADVISAFSFQGMDVFDKIRNTVEQSKSEAPRKIYELVRNNTDLKLPDDLQIPNIPNIPSPSLERRTDMNLVKKKVWPGFDLGDKNIIAASANAWLEVRSAKNALDVRGEARADAYILANQVNLLHGQGLFTAVPDGVSGFVQLGAFGQEIARKDIDKTLKTSGGNPKLLSKNIRPEYTQVFMIGPVPVTCREWIQGEVAAGWGYALNTMSVKGSVFGSAELSVGASASVGGSFKGLQAITAEAGIRGSLILLKQEIPLNGVAEINTDKDGIPYLDMSIKAIDKSTTLSGSIGFYVDICVPRIEYPCGGTWNDPVRTCVEGGCNETYRPLFEWPGTINERTILDWGMIISPNGVKLSGELIDQTDLKEQEQFQKAVLLDERRVQLEKEKYDLAVREKKLMEAIYFDLSSKAEGDVAAYAQSNLEASNQLEAQRRVLLKKLLTP